MARPAAAGTLTAPGAAQATGVSIATRQDDAEMCGLLRRAEMAGAVRVALTREPSYFAGVGLAGATDYPLVHRSDGRLDGVAHLGVTTLYRNGAPQRIGYLGELRLDPGTPRRARVLRDGYAFLRECVAASGVEGCVTSIASDNQRARQVLEHGARLGLPTYTPIADLTTLVTAVRRGPVGEPTAPVDREELSAFLDRHAARRQLGITWDDARWDALAVHGITPGEFHVLHEGGRVVAAGAVWDQRSFKQAVVCGYAGALALARPVVNALALTGIVPPLPAPGRVLSFASLFGAAVEAPRHVAPLWCALRASARRRGIAWLAIARDARDAELGAWRQVAGGRTYHTRLYDVRWADTTPWPEPWDARAFGPEVALL